MRPELQILDVDLRTAADTCVGFMRDSFLQSFGDPTVWDHTFGPDGALYREWLGSYGGRMYHGWLGGRIVGELMYEPSQVYLQHIYVIPDFRGQGFGRRLHDFFLTDVKAGGRVASLKVSRSNTAAIRFYEALNWRKSGADEQDGKLDLYHRELC